MPALKRSVVAQDVARIRAVESRSLAHADDATLRRDGAVAVHECTVGVHDGVALDLLVLRPTSGSGPWPGVVHIHGGGMMFGTNRTGLAPFAEWVSALGVVVASISYRLAPEHPDPAPRDDCYAMTCWVAAHGREIGMDPSPLIIAGSSAGGGLAATVALLARERCGPALRAQILLSPMLDDRTTMPTTTTIAELDGRTPWDRRSNLTAWSALLGARRGTDAVSPFAAPARCLELGGLPPTYLDVGAVEVFREEAMAYALRLAGAGVAVDAHLWAGAFHGFDALAPTSDVAMTARRTRLDYLRRLLRSRASQ